LLEQLDPKLAGQKVLKLNYERNSTTQIENHNQLKLLLTLLGKLTEDDQDDLLDEFAEEKENGEGSVDLSLEFENFLDKIKNRVRDSKSKTKESYSTRLRLSSNKAVTHHIQKSPDQSSSFPKLNFHG